MSHAVPIDAAPASPPQAVAAVRWWKRGPVGRVGVPPCPAEARIDRALSITAAALVLAIDLLAMRTVPPLRRAFV